MVSSRAEIRFQPIGFIHTPFSNIEGMPIQPAGARGIQGTVELYPQYREGLKDLDGFSHIILLYHFHRSQGHKLVVKPFLDDEERGVFAVRAPRRPNPIGFSVVRLLRVEGGTLYVEEVDMLDGTPLLDIKPFVPQFDAPAVERVGWLEKHVKKVAQVVADGRFRD